jgi:hypothetical protein
MTTTGSETQENLMALLPDHWRRFAWIALSAAIAAVSYWMFFRGAG